MNNIQNITIPTKRLDEFSKIIEAYNWKEILRTNQYFSEEVVFNQPKKLVKNLSLIQKQ